MDADTCVGLMPDNSYEWGTYHCNQKNVGLCEKRLPCEASATFVLHAHDVDTTDQSITPTLDAQSEEECSTLCLESCPECMYFIHVNGTCRLFDDVTPSSLVIQRAGARVFCKTQ
ncbi:uncharacterized protein LOC124265226 [Haliotis rubra]|uniref:uncharacterized protein LOC124265226 n=1 Tax=Haliotis rubra TaxID=36100 RepID=UPI001EE52DA7|nr:uncharacterized protein LOC124265226 [Haliotis rubra]